MIFFFLFLQVRERERELLICYSTKRVGKRRRRRRASLGRVWEEFDLRSCSASAHAWDQLHITMMKSHSFSKWGRENVPYYDAIMCRNTLKFQGLWQGQEFIAVRGTVDDLSADISTIMYKYQNQSSTYLKTKPIVIFSNAKPFQST